MSDFCVGAYSSSAISRANYLAAVAQRCQGQPRKRSKALAPKVPTRAERVRQFLAVEKQDKHEAEIIVNAFAASGKTVAEMQAALAEQKLPVPSAAYLKNLAESKPKESRAYREARKRDRAGLESLCREWNAHTFWVLAVMLIFPPAAVIAMVFQFGKGLFLGSQRLLR